ncbi:MAG TPA: hypothetical protein VFV23_00760 [Verrucomicrobiae bacterium]|nr:hypothetical protein [Verrucomicrobiae bacterium]
MADTKYKRLTGARSKSVLALAVMTRSSLWLGDDHLLAVDSTGWTETYKRFYFRDIQAITVWKTKRRMIWNAILLTPLVLSLTGLMVSVFPARSMGAIIAWSIIASVFIIPCLINNLLGATCRCQLRTAVQIEELPSLCRVRKTRKVMEKIRPLIIEAQGGELPAEVISNWLREFAASTTAAPARTTSHEPPRLTTP